MPTRRENRVFNAGLNKDLDIRFIQNGQYIDALNVRAGTTDNGNDGSIENVKGNSVRETQSGGAIYTMPDGINKCIGSIEDQVNKRNYWFVWNSEGSHIILSYDQTTERITEVVKDNDYSSTVYDNTTGNYSVGDIVETSSGSGVYYQCLIDIDVAAYIGAGGSNSIFNSYIWELVGNYLNFQEDYLIQADLMNRDGDTLLFWTDNFNEPKYCNVDALMGGDYPTALMADYFDIKQFSPAYRPSVNSSYDSSYGYGGLRGNFYQFKYRWINRDGMPSDWSPISEVDIYTYNSFYEGDEFDNIITVQVGRPNGLGTGVDNFWNSIEVAVKPLSNGNSGTWYHSGEIQMSKTFSSSATSGGIVWGVDTGAIQYAHTYNYVFTGKEIGPAINTDEAENVFSSVPKMAKTITVLNNNRLAFGNITDGYDTNVDLSGWSVSWEQSSPTSYPSSQENSATKTFKKGATYQFGVRFSDRKGRVSPVYTDDTLIFNSPWTDDANISWSESVQPIITIDQDSAPPSWARSWQICYREVSTMAYEGSTPDFVQLAVSSNENTQLQNYDDIYGATDYQLVPLDPLQCIAFDYTPATGNYTYSHVQGDRIRVIAKDNAASTPTNPTSGEVKDRIILRGITTSSINHVVVPGSSPNVATPPDYVESDIIEIYSTTNTEQKLWYEIGDPCLMGSDFVGAWAYLALGNGTDQQISTQDGIINIMDADCYLVRLRMDEAGSYPVTGASTRTSLGTNYGYEQPFIDMQYQSRINDRGRVNVVNDNYGEASFTDRIIFTQAFANNTDVNRLSIAYSGDIVDERNSYGSIQRIHQKGQNLFVFQERKVGYHSVSRQIIEDLNSQQLVGVSGEILSDITYLIEDYGIGTYPESFATFGYDMFFVDPNSLSVLKLSGFQFNVISDLGMKTYFDASLGQVKNYNRARIYGGYDKEFDEYVISFELEQYNESTISTSNSYLSLSQYQTQFTVDLYDNGGVDSSLPSTFTNVNGIIYPDGNNSDVYTKDSNVSVSFQNVHPLGNYMTFLGAFNVGTGSTFNSIINTDTIAYNNNKNYWSSRYSFSPETMASSQASLVSFNNGKFYLHNNGDYNEFYGTTYDSTIKFPLNQEVPNNKIYNTIGLNGDNPWSVGFTNERGQQSSLRVDDFLQSELEGMWWADILMDENTPNVTYPVIEGDFLIDDHLTTELTYAMGVIDGITITDEGSGYTSAPTVSFSGGGGSGATALAEVTGGVITNIIVTNVGSGYTSSPTVSFSGGGGSGATATASISSGLTTLNNVTSAYQISPTVNT